jgi:hypothetical protein
MYAVAVRDSDDLFLVARVHRNKRGEVFVAVPRPGRRGWDPHSSYHADGRYRVKIHGRAPRTYYLQKPDANFTGTHNMSTLPIASCEPRENHAPCKPETFDDVFEIPVDELRPEEYRTHISVDLIEPGEHPTFHSVEAFYPGARVLRQAIFREAIPWILVTLYDTHPNEL